MEFAAVQALAKSEARRIFYVSCDPATLMRDLKQLSRAYEVEDVKWFNMFPRTARFETLVVLKKANARLS
jgi:23S rRNA (uracil1939-C5)-methyltransferase